MMQLKEEGESLGVTFTQNRIEKGILAEEEEERRQQDIILMMMQTNLILVKSKA